MEIRVGRDEDAAGVIALIGACWALYPGVVLDVDGEVPELRALARYYAERCGAFFVAAEAGTVSGMVATRPVDALGSWEICKLYVDPALHGSGLGRSLLERAEDFARRAGARQLILWSDTRFDRAHRFYEKHAYVRSGPIRVLHDISRSLEFRYAKPLCGVDVLDVAAASSAARLMARVLVGCVDAGDPVGFLAPLDEKQALRLWDRVALDIGSGTRRMAGAWHNGALVGGGTILLDVLPARAHVAEIDRLMILPHARRHGYGRRIVAALAAEASKAGCSVLTARLPQTDAAQALCRSSGFQVIGSIPGYERDSRGTLLAGEIAWRRVG
jgi:GNAT superfamily N-acetyltransferase